MLASDLPRAMETAAVAGFDPSPDRRWREIDIGHWEGLTREEVNRRFPDEITKANAGEPVRLGGGESWAELAVRVKRAVSELAAEIPDGSRVLVFTHGGVIHAAVEAGLGLVGRHLTDDGNSRLGHVRNASVTRVVAGASEFRLDSYNDVVHLGIGPAHGPVIALIRHGESEANVAGRWHGRTDGPLSEHGRAQAVALGERYLDVTRVFASPLARARETAEAFAASHHIEVGIRDDLVEIDLGVWENLTVAEISERHPDEWAAVFEHGHDLPRGGTGETSAGAGARLGAAIDDVAARHAGERVALVSHGGLIWAAIARIIGIEWQAWRSLGFPGNASVTHVGVDGAPALVDYNTGAPPLRARVES